MVTFIACAPKTYTPKLVQHVKGSVFKPTDTGYYSTELVLKPQKPKVGKNSAHLIIHDYEATDIPGLKITANLNKTGEEIKPDNQPTVKDAGRGLYIIENINFSEPGQWEMKLTIKGPYKKDTVVLSLPEVK
jgi:hypothetical protein